MSVCVCVCLCVSSLCFSVYVSLCFSVYASLCVCVSLCMCLAISFFLPHSLFVCVGEIAAKDRRQRGVKMKYDMRHRSKLSGRYL
jgi:hypothetical protein